MGRYHIIYIAAISLLLALLVIAWSRPGEKPDVVERIKADTVIVVKYDTVTSTHVVEIEKRIVDTVYIKAEKDGFASVPIREYRFFREGEYDIIARGYDVSLPKVSVFPKTKYVTVTETREREILVHEWNFYLGGGIWRYSGEWIPNIAFAVKTPQKWLISLNMGYYDKNIIYGGTISYKLGKK